MKVEHLDRKATVKRNKDDNCKVLVTVLKLLE